MKKKIALLLLTVMAISLVGCGEKETTNGNDNANDNQVVGDDTTVDDNTTNDENADSNAEIQEGAAGVLQNIWNAYDESEKFAVGGGDSNNLNMDGPGTFDVTSVEELNGTLGFPETHADKIDDAASLMHMLNANTFTAGIFHVTNSEDIATVAEAIKDNIMVREWICGFPQKLLILSVDDNYVITAFGAEDLLDLFEQKATETYENASVLYDENLDV